MLNSDLTDYDFGFTDNVYDYRGLIILDYGFIVKLHYFLFKTNFKNRCNLIINW
jgi:hypothetical protein